MSIVIRPQAEADIDAIADFIALDNPLAAERWVDELFATFLMLGRRPGMGRPREDVAFGLRTFPKGRYLIVFRRSGETTTIVRIVHGARDWTKLIR
jgi:toxin ParE1/3/4